MQYPAKLRPGDRVALVAPSGPLAEGSLEKAVQLVESLELTPVVYESCRARHGYLAGPDALRAADLMRAFADCAVRGIWCARGGYGAARLLEGLDFDEIGSMPKFFGGYSDITALHIALGQRCGLPTYHLPMPAAGDPPDDYTRAMLRRALFGDLSGPLENPPGRPLRALVRGRGEGPLIGGNLSVLAATLGTPYEIDTRGKVLFLEEVGEEPYRVDGMLTQLRLAGKLHSAAAILLGGWTRCDAPDPALSLTLEQVFREVVAPVGRPTLAGLACGHVSTTMALPLGAWARVEAGETAGVWVTEAR